MDLAAVKIIALLVGIILGSLIVLTILVVSSKNKNFTTNGLGFCVLGVVLVGMSIWTSIKIELPGGIVVELEKRLRESEQIVASIKEEKAALAEQVQGLETTLNQIRPTAQDVKKVQDMKATISDIKDRNINIDSKLRTLDATTKASRYELERLKKTPKISPKKQE